MIEDYDICPKCGQKVLIGATRCMSCRAVLKTEEEQKAMIRKFTEQKKGFDKAALVKFIMYLIAFGVLYYFFSEKIMTFIGYLTNKLISPLSRLSLEILSNQENSSMLCIGVSNNSLPSREGKIPRGSAAG